MRSKHLCEVTCQLIVLLHFAHTKVVSQKVANFRSPSYMPDQVALELTQMQNGYSAPKYQQENYGAYANAFTEPESGEELIKKLKPNRSIIRHTGTREEVYTEVETDEYANKRFAVKDVVVDFDELVNKVRDKLKDKFEENKKANDKQNAGHGRKKELRNNPDTGNTDKNLYLKNIYKFNVNNQEKANEPREAWKHFMATKSPKTADVVSDSYASPVRVPMKKSKKQVHSKEELFEVADMTNVKDSYEDYVTPKRNKIYASDTETETKYSLPNNEDEQKEIYKENEELHNKNIPKAAIKAVRSSDKLRKIRKLDDPINYVQEEYDPNETEKPVEHAEKAMFVKLGGDSDDKPAKLKGTMIPTREFFKMSSPNYFGKIPAVAEKYDFNEPLPDKDREPEKFKHFYNPPSRINKKVKLQANSEGL